MSHITAQGLSLSHPTIMEAFALAALLADQRRASPALRVVFTNGCYDILHPGHVDLLTRARALGHVLVLGLNTDDSVRRLGKGPDRPVNPLAVRAYMAAHVKAVDYVTSFAEDTPLQLIRLLRPHVLVKGGDWPPETIVGAEEVRHWGGSVHSLPLLGAFSTSSLLAHIRKQGT